ncbi:exonuclease SbcCD subunit D [Nocardioides sp.]|uniref:exonuclease SbcCD subunit D n=1 Tax=Nocardioides sp. TaxID=35761 RepID=UPI0035160F2A
MRLLHTSDWHLGRSFHREGMLAHQAAFLDHLLEVVESEDVDLVVVSGDVYDRALPPVDAVALFDDALVRLAASRARVVLTSGNHDSALRLGFSSRLIDAAGVHLRTDPADVGAPVLLADEHGTVAVYGLPYLEPSLVAPLYGLEGPASRSHEAVLGEALRRVRADLAERPDGTRAVVMAHAFVAGAAPSESERDISVGGVARVPTTLFDDLHYVALGHLHGAHTLAPHLRYSGSPLAYSFSESEQTKGSWLVDLGADGVTEARFVPAPVPRPLARLRGTLEELLTAAEHEPATGAWVEATLTDVVRPSQAMERLRGRFPHALVLRFESTAAPIGAPPGAPARGRGDLEIATEFVEALRGAPATDAEVALLQEAVDACCTAAAEAGR